MRSVRLGFVDDKLMAGEFITGDIVRKTGVRDFAMSPYVGRVLYSNVDIGKVQVQWPWGVEQESPTELVRIHSDEIFAPETSDQSLSTWEKTRHEDGKPAEKANAKFRKSLAARVVDAYETQTMPLYRAACEAWHCQLPEFETFIKMSSAFGDEFGADAIRLTISNVYEAGRRLAIYWHNNKRKYRVTQQEQDSKKFACPRCKGLLRPRVYRQGRRIMMCKGCGFTIAPADLV